MKTTEHVLKAKTILAAKGEQTMEKIEAFMTEELKETYTGTKLESSEVEWLKGNFWKLISQPTH